MGSSECRPRPDPDGGRFSSTRCASRRGGVVSDSGECAPPVATSSAVTAHTGRFGQPTVSARTITQSYSMTRPLCSMVTGNIPLIAKPADS